MIEIRPIIKTNKEFDPERIVLFGPWLGEFGPELIYWQGFIRWYCTNHPEEYIIALAPIGNSVMYELVDEYWGISIPSNLEPNFYLPDRRIGRQGLYKIVDKLSNMGFHFDALGLPDRLHEYGWIQFGRPSFNQIFKELVPSLRIKRLLEKVLDPTKRRIILFPRNRSADAAKNWESWKDLAAELIFSGFQVLIGGGPKSKYEIDNCFNPWDLEVDASNWLDLQLGLIAASDLVVSGESGPGFLPGLCCRPGIVFGSPREEERYKTIDNIFSSRVLYIPSRSPTLRDLLFSIERVLE